MMFQKEKNKLLMYHAVDAVLTKFQSNIDLFPPMSVAVTKFRSKLAEINNRNMEHTGTKSATAAKNSAVVEMERKTNKIASALYTLGRATGNEELKLSCNMSESDLEHSTDAESEKYCSCILSFAQTYASSLVDYQISAETISSLGQALELYRKQLDGKNTKSAGSKAARKVLKTLFPEVDEILNEDIDNFVKIGKDDNPDFYNQYFAARDVKDIGGSHQTKGKVQDSLVVTPEKEAASVN